MSIATLVESILGRDLPIAFEAYDGSRCGPSGAGTTIVVRSPDVLRRLLTAPGELGLGRAYVAGDLDIEGDVFAALELRHRVRDLRLSPSQIVEVTRLLGASGLRPLPPPPEEARLRGRRHTKARDAAAIAHHYDVSNDFYRLVLGSTMTYSCALFDDPATPLAQAQEAKYELICRKLRLEPGMRLLDVGCGWGGMVLHAAEHHGVDAVGVTISTAQADLAAKRVAEAGLLGRVDIRTQDYRDIDDGPYDAISSIGMFEHVGLARLAEYFDRLHALLRPAGRLLNHGISRPAQRRRRFTPATSHFRRRSFIDRYVFPDGELHEVGQVVSAMQQRGFEVRHLESLREHYALTLRAWVANLERHWEEAVGLVGPARARVWRLYMAGSAVNFEDGNTQIHQVLAARPDGGRSGFALRPSY
jgi:cyclopropane-fatty-acyl-phospholipid synthase